jgi:ATP-dependent DNA helicase RecQ
LSDRLPFVVCTNAFGLGINKPNTRWIIHYHMPSLLTEYLQEIGRAGRDGLPAEALALVSEPTGWLDPSDRDRQTFFQEQFEKQQHQAQLLAKTLTPQGDLRTPDGSPSPLQDPSTQLALAHLHRRGQLTWLDPFRYQLQPVPQPQPTKLPASTQPPVTTHQFLYRNHCRWQMLLRAFGFDQEATQFQCGHCDRCRRKGIAKP